MQKRILSILLILAMVFGLGMTSLTDVQAADTNRKVDGSYLTSDEYSEGTTSSGITTRGEHMMDGICSITKSGVGKIYAYGSTTANRYVDYLAVAVYVEQYNATADRWEQIYTWMDEKVNDTYISTAKIVYVDRGYYYRVRAEHVCGNNGAPYDEEFSFTDGILIP